MEAAELVKLIRAQNWKNGGVLAMDVDEAERLLAEALQESFDLGFRAAGGTITPLPKIEETALFGVFEPGVK